MKTFDWEIAKSRMSPKAYEFLFELHDIAITEEAFVKGWGELKKYSRTNGKEVVGKAKKLNAKYGPSGARKNYQNLKKEFGFFQ